MAGAIGRFFSRYVYAGPAVSHIEDNNMQTAQLLSQARALYSQTRLQEKSLDEISFNFAQYILLHSPIPISQATLDALHALWADLLVHEGMFPPPENPRTDGDGYAQQALQNLLKKQIHFFGHEEEHINLLSEWMLHICEVIANHIAPEIKHHGSDDAFSARLIDLCEDPADVVDAIMRAIWSHEISEAQLLQDLREATELSTRRASGIHSMPSSKPLIYPPDYRWEKCDELVSAYLGNTAFPKLLYAPVALSLPTQSRFEHCHIVGGTGHGKTQLLQYLIAKDFEQARSGGQSVVVIDSQGEMIEKIRRLSVFEHDGGDLAQDLVIIDPYDVEYPPSLNLFAINRERLDEYPPADQERIFNGIVELYETFFGSLLGAELTQKQGVLFSFLARLMLEIPDANIHTLQEVMQDGERFRPYMEQLDGAARFFFETEFFSRSFSPTKTQIARRLYGVLSIPAFERMFGARENKLDMFELLNRGSIILISTAKDLMKAEGSALFGRFFIASLTQAVLERAVIPAGERTAVHLYIDEAQEYLDENIETLLNQARKYKCAVHLAHQHLDQLSPRLRSTLAANTSIKCVGGLSHKDSVAFANEVGMPTDTLRSLSKSDSSTEFALWVKHTTPRAIPINVPLGCLEQQDQMLDDGMSVQRHFNRLLYQAPREESFRQSVPSNKQKPEKARVKESDNTYQTTIELYDRSGSVSKQPISEERELEATAETDQLINPKVPGRGGKEHKYLQEVIRNLGQTHGYRADVEAKLESGGAVDVLLTKDGKRIACEVALNTAVSYEVGNISKSLDAGIETVVVISPKPKHLQAIEDQAKQRLSESQLQSVSFISPELLSEYLDSSTHQTTTVRGYKVRVSHYVSDGDALKRKRERVAGILASAKAN